MAKRCKDYPLKDHQHLFGIIQGGLEFDLRTESMERLEEMNFPALLLGTFCRRKKSGNGGLL